jgi:hypothetical protein
MLWSKTFWLIFLFRRVLQSMHGEGGDFKLVNFIELGSFFNELKLYFLGKQARLVVR